MSIIRNNELDQALKIRKYNTCIVKRHKRKFPERLTSSLEQVKRWYELEDAINVIIKHSGKLGHFDKKYAELIIEKLKEI